VSDQKQTQRKEVDFVRRDYELGFILNPEANEDQIRALLERIEQIVANHGGQIVKVNQWGRRRLAYPIERHRDGYYIFIDMILTPESVSELEYTMKVTETILRYMVKKRDPKAVQKERAERAEREAREARAAEAAAAAEAAKAEQAEQTEATEAPAQEAPAEEAPQATEEESSTPASSEGESVQA